MAAISDVQFLKIADRMAAQYELLKTVETQGSSAENAASLLIGNPQKARKTFSRSKNQLAEVKGFTTANSDQIGTQTLEIATPTGTTTEDLLLLVIGAEGAITGGPAGFTSLVNSNGTYGGYAIFYKIAGASEAASFTATMGQDDYFATLYRIEGSLAAGNPTDATAAETNTGLTVDIGAVTPASPAYAQRQFAIAVSAGPGTWTPPSPSGLVEDAQFSTSSSGGTSVWVGHSTDLLSAASSAETLTHTVSESKATFTVTIESKLEFTSVGDDFMIRAVSPGASGNTIQVFLIDPGANDATLLPDHFGNELRINLATDGSGNITTTAADIINVLQTHDYYSSRVALELFKVDYTGVVEALDTTLELGTGDDALTFTAATVGKEGNDLSVAFVDPSASGQTLSLSIVNNQALTVNLATDSNSVIITTPALIKTAIEADYQANSLFTVTLYGAGDLPVSALAATNLAGGLNGPYADTVLAEPPGQDRCQADPDVAIMATQAQTADNNLTARILAKGVTIFENLQAALTVHLSSVGETSIGTYLSTRSIKVHENFSLIQSERTGTAFDAAKVFKATALELGTVTIDGGNAVLTPGTALGVGSGAQSNTNYAAQKVELEYIPNSVQSAVQIDPAGSNDALAWTAVNAGVLGDNITIAYIDPGANDATLSVVVVQNDIVVNLATGVAGAITSTAQEILDAVAASSPASALVTGALVTGNDGTGVVTAIAETNLANGAGNLQVADVVLSLTMTDDSAASVIVTEVRFDTTDWPNKKETLAQRATFTTTAVTDINDQIKYTAKDGGLAGNSITIAYVDPAAINQSLSVALSTTAITVNLATDGAGAITSTAATIRTALLANSSIAALLYIELLGDGSEVAEAITATALTGGLDAPDFLAITNASLVSGGTDGDQVVLRSIIERNITL
jgi:hypothetical protein